MIKQNFIKVMSPDDYYSIINPAHIKDTGMSVEELLNICKRDVPDWALFQPHDVASADIFKKCNEQGIPLALVADDKKVAFFEIYPEHLEDYSDGFIQILTPEEYWGLEDESTPPKSLSVSDLMDLMEFDSEIDLGFISNWFYSVTAESLIHCRENDIPLVLVFDGKEMEFFEVDSENIKPFSLDNYYEELYEEITSIEKEEESFQKSAHTKLEEISYELYKMDWVNTHIPFESQLCAYRLYALDLFEGNCDKSYSFNDFLFDEGYEGSIYSCFEEFLETEYKDINYMKYLLGNSVYFNEYCKSNGKNISLDEKIKDTCHFTNKNPKRENKNTEHSKEKC